MNARKCKIVARMRRLPVEGSVVSGKGRCPECLTDGIKLSAKGFIGAHSVDVDVDPTAPVVDTGLPKGDPRDAAVRREIEARKGKASGAPVPAASVMPVAGGSDGPALIRGRDMATRVVDPSTLLLPEEFTVDMTPVRETEKPRGNTMSGNLGRPHFDRTITGGRDKGRKPGLTRTQRRNAQRKAVRGVVADLQRRVAVLEGK